MNGLLEIMTNKFWMIEPNAARAIRKTFESNLNGHIPVGQFEKKASFAVGKDASPIVEYAIDEEGEAYSSSYTSHLKTPFVNVVQIDGPVTRNGGACSYGSVDHRDQVFEASDNPMCRGHVFLIDTPGGSAWAINDYKQCIDYAKSKGLPVYAFIDGMCCSAGMYLASLCDKRFYMHPKDEIGCIGVMCAFYSEKDGSHNAYTNETFHEVYEPESYDKNKWYRDIANDGDDKELVERLVTLGNEFRADVKKACPNAQEEHLHGKIFNAADVKGILVDEQSTFGDVVALCFSAYEKNNPSSNNSPMDEKYLPLATACGVDELVMDEDGTHLSMPLVDKLTEKINADAEALANAQQQISDLLDAHQTAIAQVEENYSTAIAQQMAENESLKASNTTLLEEVGQVEELRASNAQSQLDLAEAQNQLAETQNSLEQAQQQIADLEQQIRDLTSQAAATHDAAPANNGLGLSTEPGISYPPYDENLTPMENAQRLADWKKKHGVR